MTVPRPWVLATAVVALAVIAYLPSLSGGWIYDDYLLIPLNPHAHSFSEWTWWLTHDFWHTDDETVRAGGRIIYWRPLISASYATDWTIGNGSPLMFHITNIVTHAIAAALAFVVLRRWIGSLIPAVLAAALFAVHPTKAESVAWIAGRTDVFCMIAMFVATIGIGRRLRGQRSGLPLEIAGTIGAYLCKEQAIVLPAFVLVELWLSLDRPAIDLAFVRRSVRAVAPQSFIAVGYLAVRAAVLPVRTSPPEIPVVQHVLAVFDSLGRYIELTFLPIDLSIQHGLVYSLSRPTHSLPHVALGIVALVGGALLAWWARRRISAVTMGIIVFAVTITPTVNIVYGGMVTLISERFLYLPMLGVALAVGAVLARIEGRAKSITVRVVVCVVIALFAVQSARRSADFSDEERFWTHELERNPDSREARYYKIAAAIRAKHYPTALRELLAMKDEIRQLTLGFEFTVMVAEVTSQLVPDLAVDELRAIDTFASQVLSREVPQVTLSVRGVELGVKTQTPTMIEGLDRMGIRLYALRATLAARLGDAEAARAHVASAVHLCGTCTTVITTKALTLARLGDIDGGLATIANARGVIADEPLERLQQRLLDARGHRDRSLTASGPSAIRSHAAQLAALELWGEAYRVLEPYREQIAQAPGVALGFAELAFRAGAADVAREVLALHATAEEIDTTILRWTDAMGWLH